MKLPKTIYARFDEEDDVLIADLRPRHFDPDETFGEYRLVAKIKNTLTQVRTPLTNGDHAA